MNNPRMDSGVAAAAECNQVVDRVVSLCSRGGTPFAIDVMNMQVTACATMLAGVAIAIQSYQPVSIEVVIALGLLAILGGQFGVSLQPFVDARNFILALTRWASTLWARTIFKVVAALRAAEYRSDLNCTKFAPPFCEGVSVASGADNWGAGEADLLVAPGWLVLHPAFIALPLNVPASGLTTRLHRARVAALHVWRFSLRFGTTIRAIERLILPHNKNSVKIISQHSIGGEHV